MSEEIATKLARELDIPVIAISQLSRATQGVRIMKMREGDSIASMAAL